MDNLLESLQKIGLSKKESKIYLSLLSLGSASVSDIADKDEIKRPTTYLILDELRKKGLVLKIPHAKKTIFQAKRPDELYEQAVSNINSFERALPKLLSINQPSKTTKTFYYEGMEGMKEAIAYKINKLKGKKLVAFWARNKTLPATTLDIYKGWNKKYEKLDIDIKVITPKDETSVEYFKQFPKIYGNMKFISEQDYSSEISIEACDDFVRIVDGHELKAVIIENRRISDSIKQIFDLVEKSIK